MSEQALDAHLDYQEQRPPEEMVMVEKAYLEWAGQKIAQLDQLKADLEGEIAQLRTKCKAYRAALKLCEAHTLHVANTLNKQCAQLEAKNAELKIGMEQNLRSAQHAEAKLIAMQCGDCEKNMLECECVDISTSE